MPSARLGRRIERSISEVRLHFGHGGGYLVERGAERWGPKAAGGGGGGRGGGFGLGMGGLGLPLMFCWFDG